MGKPIDDAIIDRLLEEAKLKQEKYREILRQSYGHNFSNAATLMQIDICYGDSLVTYDGIDPENENLIKIQYVKQIHQEDQSYDPAYREQGPTYKGVTRWFDAFGVEIKREIRISDSTEDLAKAKVHRVITREEGLIKHKTYILYAKEDGFEETFFDTGAPVLPDYDHEVDVIAYPTYRKGKVVSEKPDISQIEKQMLFYYNY